MYAKPLCILLGLAVPHFAGGAELYSLGNSLTFDALRNYQGSVEYTINCNQNLNRIFENPSETCLPRKAESRPWDQAFADTSYEFVTVQPFRGTTLAEDVSAISSWMDLQPDAAFIIHTGWTSAGARESTYNAALGDGMMKHSVAYFDALSSELENLQPDRVIGSTNIIGILQGIAEDIARDASAVDSIENLYRDPIHCNAAGQYIATNAFNRALGKSFTDVGFESVDQSVRNYFDSEILASVETVPEPSSLVIILAGAGVALARRKKTA